MLESDHREGSWFDDWALNFRGDVSDTKPSKWLVHLTAVVPIILGLGFLWVSRELECHEEISFYFSHLAVALIVAGIIGLTIEIAFATRLAGNVFEAAFGYVLPDELKEEVRWVYNLPFLAISHRHDYALQLTDSGEISFIEEMQREIKNVTGKPQVFKLDLGVHEWKKGNIIKYYFKYEEIVYELGNPFTAENTQDRRQVISGNPRSVKVKSGGVFQLYHRVEYADQGWSGDFVSYSEVGSRNPEIIVRIDPEIIDQIDFMFNFASRLTQEPTRQGMGKKLRGTLLPYQAIRFRWWKKPESGTKPPGSSPRSPKSGS